MLYKLPIIVALSFANLLSAAAVKKEATTEDLDKQINELIELQSQLKDQAKYKTASTNYVSKFNDIEATVKELNGLAIGRRSSTLDNAIAALKKHASVFVKLWGILSSEKNLVSKKAELKSSQAYKSQERQDNAAERTNLTIEFSDKHFISPTRTKIKMAILKLVRALGEFDEETSDQIKELLKAN